MKLQYLCLFVVCFMRLAYAENYVDGVLYNDSIRYNMNSNTTISQNGVLDYLAVDITDAITLVNYGVIMSDVYITYGNGVIVQNPGQICGKIYVANNASLTQVIYNAADIVALDVDSAYKISVEYADALSLNDVIDIAGNSNKIIVKDSDVVLNSVALGAGEIEFNGIVVLHVDYNFTNNEAVLSNVKNNGIVQVKTNMDNPLFVTDSKIINNNLYVFVTRETDYDKIFENNLGLFLNKLRFSNPGDKLLVALDSAQDMDAINYIMSQSVRLRPEKLMKPIKIMNRIFALDTSERDLHENLSVRTSYVFSSAYDMMRVSAHSDLSVSDNIMGRINTYIAGFSESDSLNEYQGGVIGADISAYYNDSFLVGRMTVGLNVTTFDTGYVFDGNREIENPVGVSCYYNADFGLSAIRGSEFDVVPYIGMLGDGNYIVGKSDYRFVGNVGTDIYFKAGDYDIKYYYGMRGGLLTDGSLYANGIIKFVLPQDSISGGLSLGVLDDDFGTDYKVSIMGRYVF